MRGYEFDEGVVKLAAQTIARRGRLKEHRTPLGCRDLAFYIVTRFPACDGIESLEPARR
jgi:hypothetical protein